MKKPTPTAGGRVVLVTGGSRGIGLATARWFLARGDRVAITARGPWTGNQPEVTSSDGSGPVEDVGDRFLPLVCNVTDGEQVEAAFSAIEERWGPVQVLVANAGITKDTLVMRMRQDMWNEVIDTNLTGAFRVTKRAVGKMLRLHEGRIIFISSVVAFVGSAGQVNYAASKAGMVGMARSLAREVASRGITVNVVAPGVVDTDMMTALGEERADRLRSMVPLERMASAEEIAEAVGFLASDGAGYITGVTLPVDGGLAMGH